MADTDSASYTSASSSRSSKHQDHAASSHQSSTSSRATSSHSSRRHQTVSYSHRSTTSTDRHHAGLSYGTSPEPLLLPSKVTQRVPSSPGLSAEEFKARLYRSFKDRGLVDSLKSQLRTKLVAELQQTALIEHRQSKDNKPLLEGASLLHRAANSLVADHLKRCGYDYSLAVFLPESESAKDKLFTLHDLLDLLKIHPDSKLGKKLVADLLSSQSKGLLWQFLCEVARSHRGGSEEKGVQVEEHPPHLSSLESKLKSVDRLYSSKSEEENLSQYGSMQDKLVSLQRQMETRFKMETNLEISRFKESELKRVELVERDKCRKEIANARKEMEYTYRAKSDALQERDRSAMDRLQKEREHVERETYAQRQSLLEELQVLRQREKELKREADVNARAAKFEEERCKTMEENLKVRETAVANIQETYEKRLKKQTRQFELEMQAKYSDRLREMDEKDSKMRAEKRNLQQESESLKGLKDDVKEKETRLKELETLLQQMRHDSITAEKRNEVLNEKVRDMIDYPSVKETNAVLRRELDNSKMRLSELTNEHRIEKARHEEMLKQMTDQISRPSPELMTLQGDLTRARQQLQHEKTVTAHRETQLKDKWHSEREQTLELRRQLEEQSRQMADMNKQLSDLKSLLRETQTALENEIYRRPTGPSAGAPYTGSPTHSYLVPVHDQLEPEDQYLDSRLRQTRIDPHLMLASREQQNVTSGHLRFNNTVRQRLLVDDDTHEDLQPMAGLDTPGTSHQFYTGRQRLLADEESQDNIQPMAGLDTTIQSSRHRADDGNSRVFAPMQGLEATATDDDEDVSADNSLAFLEETRQRFRQLEREAENLEQTYQNLQHRALNPQALPSSPRRPRTQTQTREGGHPQSSLEFGTPWQARQTDLKVTKPFSPPEPLVEYPLRDSMESANVPNFRPLPQTKRESYNGSRLLETTVGENPPHDTMESSAIIQSTSHYRTLPLQKRLETTDVQGTQGTPLESFPMDSRLDSTKLTENRSSVQSQKRLETTDVQGTQGTPLESFPMDSRLDSTKLTENRSSVQSDSGLMPERRQDIPLQIRGAHGMRTVALPPYEERSSEVFGPSGNQQTVLDNNSPPVGKQRSQLLQGISPPHNDHSSGRLRFDPAHLPRSDDFSNLPDQSHVHMKSHRDSSVSSLSEHSLPLGEDTTLGTTGVLPRDMVGSTGVLPRDTVGTTGVLPRQSSSEDDLLGGKPYGVQADEKGSSGFIPQREHEEERLRQLREEEEKEEREWEEKRRQKEEERRKREADARERERQMLLELQRQEEPSSLTKDATKDTETRDEQEETNADKSKTEAATAENQEAGLQIDPVMQKYMQMVQQRKQQESSGSKVTMPKQEEEEVEEKASILSGLSLATISGEDMDEVEKQNSQGASTDGEDPFDDW